METNTQLRISPRWITALTSNEIFVFGSNLAGFHGGGAADFYFLFHHKQKKDKYLYKIIFQ
jgi:hypothetical protein